MTDYAPGIYPGLTEAEYRAIEAVNQSALKLMARSPAHFRWTVDHPDERDSEALRIGRVAHLLALQPTQAAELIAVAPECDRRTKEGKAVYEAFLGELGEREWVGAEEYAVAQAVAAAARAHKGAGPILTAEGLEEVVIVWQDDDTRVLCKGRIDRLLASAKLVLDFKTATDASPGAMEWTARRYGYDVQAAFYIDGLAALGHAGYSYVIVSAEKAPPYGVSVCAPARHRIDFGRNIYRSLLRRVDECAQRGEWPGYPETVYELVGPPSAGSIPRAAGDDDHPF